MKSQDTYLVWRSGRSKEEPIWELWSIDVFSFFSRAAVSNKRMGRGKTEEEKETEVVELETFVFHFWPQVFDKSMQASNYKVVAFSYIKAGWVVGREWMMTGWVVGQE